MTPVTEATLALKLTERINRIEPSATMAVVAEADKLRQQGIDVVDFGAGEPHFATPQHIKDAGVAAIQGNFTKYTAVSGTTELRDAIAHRHAVDFDSDYRREEVIASTGGKQALFNAVQVLVDHGDEVILPVPYWVSSKICGTRGFLKKVIAMYPGSFDPPTNGHLDLIERGSKIFDELVVAILRNAEKAPLFNLSERLLMLEAMTADFKNVRVETFDGLMVEYAAKVKASAVLRGIRAISDYEYELQMALMNRKLQPDLETVFMMPAEQYSYLSSRLVREIAQLGGSVKDLVPDLVVQRLKEKLDPAVKLANARNLKQRKRG